MTKHKYSVHPTKIQYLLPMHSNEIKQNNSNVVFIYLSIYIYINTLYCIYIQYVIYIVYYIYIYVL